MAVPVLKGNVGKVFFEASHFPYVETDEIVNWFHKLVYEGGWVICDYNWREQSGFLADEEHIVQASLGDIRKAFTYAVRSERFCEGNLVKLFKAGVIQKLLKRLENLHQTENKKCQQRL